MTLGKRVQPDSSGLQAVENDHGPEVVSAFHEHDMSSPEVVPPQLHHQQQQYVNEKGYYMPRQDEIYGSPNNSSFPTSTHSPPVHQNGYFPVASNDYAGQSVKPGDDNDLEKVPHKRRRKYLGMKRNVFVLVIVLVVVVIIAAVLGAVLGSVLSNSNSSSSSQQQQQPSGSPPPSSDTGSNATTLQVSEGSGLATAVSSSGGSTYTYYQDDHGTVLEALFGNQNWTQSGSSSIVTTMATKGSPLAATSYTFQGVDFRALFFLDANGALLTTNCSGSSWSEPASILTDDAAAPGSIGLSVCSGTDSNALNGIRVYYGSQKGYIQEVGMDFADSVWNMWATFHGSDQDSGVSCIVADNFNHLYLRNSSTKAVQQWQWNYADVTTWVKSPRASANATMVQGSDIAAAYDGSSTDYIFWTSPENALVRGMYVGQDSAFFDGYATGQNASASSKLAASFISGESTSGAQLMYKNASSDSASVEYWQVSRTGEQLSAGVL